MPYGFTKYLESKLYSNETIKSYIPVIETFHKIVNQQNARELLPHEINPSDIKHFLEFNRKNGHTDRTINKELSILKKYFDYLWSIDKVPVDPTVKLKRTKIQDNKTIELSYERLLEIKQDILKRNDYSTKRIIIYTLFLYGFRLSDFHIKKQDIDFTKDEAHLHLGEFTLILTGAEAELFMRYFWETSFTDNEYVFTSTTHDNVTIPISIDSLNKHLSVISNHYHLRKKLNIYDIRNYYAYYLYETCSMSLQDVADRLRIKKGSAASLVEISQKRMTKRQA
ncbi:MULTISPECIES: tyrosine-type recombinase/integrase [Bacillus]|uniref:Core-binding (CB) domain-containing protein n=2 Tax=Bacillus TaxID=1386 RepID=A0A0M4FQ42_9BACI|nr:MULTISPECIES: site-specific integrase [Bacillus]ALC81197.1 hypothetical protein AM592_06000 [Bacillus gobiensis]MBP1080179.1 site-specific recombinase XerD [Bacillus capparidis]MED1094053.1 site-specific integrase [Bacillus capparidis]